MEQEFVAERVWEGGFTKYGYGRTEWEAVLESLFDTPKEWPPHSYILVRRYEEVFNVEEA